MRARFLPALFLLSGCAGPALRSVDSPKRLGSQELVLVGKVELYPPLGPEEQKLTGVGAETLRNAVYLLLDPSRPALEREARLKDYSGRVQAQLGQTFFVARRPEPFFIKAGVVVASVERGGRRRVYLPGGLRVNVRPGDRAVYVGTLRYTRDDAFKIIRASVEDDYEQAAAEFRARFGALPLRRALPVKTGRPREDPGGALSSRTAKATY